MSAPTGTGPQDPGQDPGRSPVPPFDLVLFGATGDLAGRKLFPALLHRDAEGVLPEGSRIHAAGRGHIDDDAFRRSLEPGLVNVGADRATLDRFLRKIDYFSVDFDDPASITGLAKALEGSDRTRAFYLSVAPGYFARACTLLGESGLATPQSRIVVEKPIGHDLASATEIMDAIGKVFTEKQTYRIDHYLGKETVQNLLVLRFANTLFGKLWSNADIDHVQITVAEEVGLESRAGYYEGAGALRDMVQNHLLQLLCLVAMEPPNTLGADAIRDEKLRVLKALRPIAAADVLSRTVRGQYRRGSVNGQPVKGYEDELGRESQIETFVAIKAEIDTWRWAGVPFYLRTGKRMAEKFSEIVITFRPVPHSIFASLGSDGELSPNRLIIRLQPDDGVKFITMAKIPGSGRLRLRETELDLRFGQAFIDRSPDAYERLLTDVLRGQQTLFMRRDEVEAAWAFIDPITAGWAERYPAPHRYAAGQNGPAQAIALIERDGRSWFEPQDLGRSEG
ncbi:MAG: glucose-6-phosphate dehydrogenase [Methylocystis sp.]|nr:glucose-6-phosphate dehydrogenase [Methylocystis sp.]MCA3584451.1 glucose-6-phosphate dehydrogenase [Methylocystis sp.]MCA3587992.1 glucose-6-phosphate dehydrogenase [Methylocystis sp.]MCA3590527.1 glucose-6-phosphate dehydrogenase [Methylocystis sp.]